MTAFKVRYKDDRGKVWDPCIVRLDGPGECIAEFAGRIRDTLSKAYHRDITLISVEYVGPCFTIGEFDDADA